MASRKPKKAKSDAATETAPAAATDQEQKSAAPAASAAKKKAPKKAATRRTAPPKRRGPGRPKGSKNKAAAVAKPAAKKSARPSRYTPAERAKILAAAKREGLSGPAAAKKFGISQLTFYTWRKQTGGDSRGGKRPTRAAVGSTLRRGIDGQIGELVRREVRERLTKELPVIVAEEIQAAFWGRNRR